MDLTRRERLERLIETLKGQGIKIGWAVRFSATKEG